MWLLLLLWLRCSILLEIVLRWKGVGGWHPTATLGAQVVHPITIGSLALIPACRKICAQSVRYSCHPAPARLVKLNIKQRSSGLTNAKLCTCLTEGVCSRGYIVPLRGLLRHLVALLGLLWHLIALLRLLWHLVGLLRLLWHLVGLLWLLWHLISLLRLLWHLVGLLWLLWHLVSLLWLWGCVRIGG